MDTRYWGPKTNVRPLLVSLHQNGRELVDQKMNDAGAQ